MNKLAPLSRILIAVSACLLISAFFFPLWRIMMWAPQYPEWLQLNIWINNITGDINTINGLNHYIGMKHIRVEMFPEFRYMIYILIFLIAFGLIAAAIGRTWSLYSFFILLILLAVAALTDFYLWGYDYGHNLDPNAAIKVPGMAYQPPIIGSKQLLNFTAFSGPDIAGWLFTAAGLILILVIVLEKFHFKKRHLQ